MPQEVVFDIILLVICVLILNAAYALIILHYVPLANQGLPTMQVYVSA